MRRSAPFGRGDLRELGAFLERAEEVVAMREIAAGEQHPNVIGLRHDVDNTLDATLELARWEARHGFRATYFVLHDSPYWDTPELRPTLEEIESLGHEVGIHSNAIAVALATGREPWEVLHSALARLHAWKLSVTGHVAHGDREWCYREDASLVFVNDELLEECARPELGEPDRWIEAHGRSLRLSPVPMADFGLRYDSYRVGARALYLSDSGGRWNEEPREIMARFPHASGQLHILIHPCWWTEAFPVRAEVRA